MSADSTKRQKNFCEKQDFPFPLLSDETTDVLKAYDAWGLKKMYGRESVSYTHLRAHET